MSTAFQVDDSWATMEVDDGHHCLFGGNQNFINQIQ